MNDHSQRYIRVRQTAIGALAALAAVGAIAGAAALASNPHARHHHHHASVHGSKAQSPSDQGKGSGQPSGIDTAKARGSQQPARPDPSAQPFLDAVTQLVNNGTLTAAQGQIVDQQIQSGRVDTDELVAAGFTQSQADAVQQALGAVKQSMAPPQGATGPVKPNDGGQPVPGGKPTGGNPQAPFLAAIAQLVANKTLTPAQGLQVDGAIQDGTFDSDALASNGFTQSQIQAIENALTAAKQSVAAAKPQSLAAAKQQALANAAPGASSS